MAARWADVPEPSTRVRSWLRPWLGRPDPRDAAHFPFGHVITVDGEHQFRFLQ
jgi:hypothetical protein